jgi:hypothetical protein
VSSSWSRQCALGLPILATIAAVSLPAAPAFGRVTVTVQTASKKAVRSTVRVRVGHVIRAPIDTMDDGSHVFETMSCNDKTLFKIEPLVRLYISDNKWLPCNQMIVVQMRPVSIGAAETGDLPVSGKRASGTLAG